MTKVLTADQHSWFGRLTVLAHKCVSVKWLIRYIPCGFAQTLLQRIPAGARVVVKAIKAKAPMLVVKAGVMVSLASAAAK